MNWPWKRGGAKAGTRFTLVERSAEAFRAYLNGPLSNVFYDKEYRTELARRFAQADVRLTRALRACLFLVAVLVFSDSLAGVTVAEGLVHIPSLKPFQDAVVFLLAAASFGLSLAILDYTLLERYLKQIYYSAGIAHPRFFYMHIYPVGVWNDVLERRFGGPRSQAGHHFLRASFLLLFVVFLAGIVGVGPVTSVTYAHHILGDATKPIAARALGLFDILLSVGAVVIVVVGWFVPFSFAEAEIDEATGKPTEEFVARLQREQGGSEVHGETEAG